MTELEKQFARILADTDQDMEAGRRWFNESPLTDLMTLWLTITRPHDDPAMEIMSRLAQIQFSEFYLERMNRK